MCGKKAYLRFIFALELGLIEAVLGPEYSLSHVAAQLKYAHELDVHCC